jgi:hypothetical protein
MKQCPFCAGVIPDATTICKHCKQAIPSGRPKGSRKAAVPVWAVAAVGGVLLALGAPVLFWLRPGIGAGAATEQGRRAQLVEGLQAAQAMGTQKSQCDSPTAVADVWRKVKTVRRDDPEWEHAGKMAEQLESCRAGIARSLANSVGELRRQQRLQQAETVRRSFQTQGFDTTVKLTGDAQNDVVISSPQLTEDLLAPLTANLSMQSGSFLEAWQKLGCTRVTFTNGKQRWAYDLPRTADAYKDVSVLEGMGLGQPLTLP